ncbi:MAG TPA: hypothetical protein VL973_11945 [Sphingomonas sp.]|nr:hypothetical protein [Sphingomonas sp.]
MRRALGLTDGDEVLLRVVDGVLHVLPAREVVANIQNRLRQHLDTDASLSHELIADRRIAADHE